MNDVNPLLYSGMPEQNSEPREFVVNVEFGIRSNWIGLGCLLIFAGFIPIFLGYVMISLTPGALGVGGCVFFCALGIIFDLLIVRDKRIQPTVLTISPESFRIQRNASFFAGQIDTVYARSQFAAYECAYRRTAASGGLSSSIPYLLLFTEHHKKLMRPLHIYDDNVKPIREAMAACGIPSVEQWKAGGHPS